MHRAQRKSKRYRISGSVDVMDGDTRIAFGSLVDLSRDSVGFQSMQDLELSKVYRIEIRGFGLYKAKIIQKSGLGRYGGVFQIDEAQKTKLNVKLAAIAPTGDP